LNVSGCKSYIARASTVIRLSSPGYITPRCQAVAASWMSQAHLH
jgi:hypothetical protein